MLWRSFLSSLSPLLFFLGGNSNNSKCPFHSSTGFLKKIAFFSLQFVSVLENMGCLYDTMTTWLKWQNEVQGAFTIKVTSLGIAKLLDMQHPTLENYVVQGIRVVENANIIRTRSKVIKLVCTQLL